MISLQLIKSHLNIPGEFACDDQYLEHLMSSAEDYVYRFLDLSGEENADAIYSNILERPSVQHAMLLLIGTLYNNRESEVYAAPKELKAFSRLLYLYKRW